MFYRGFTGVTLGEILGYCKRKWKLRLRVLGLRVEAAFSVPCDMFQYRGN